METNTKKNSSTKRWSILTAVTAILLVVAIVGTGAANFCARSINMYFNLKTYRIEKNDDSGNADYFPQEYDSVEDMTVADQLLCEQVEGEGAVLLKNNGVLPLAEGTYVSTFCHSSVDPVYGGTGAGDVAVTEDTPTLYSALTDAGLNVNERLWNFYLSGNGSHEKYTRVCPPMLGGDGIYAMNEVPWSVIHAESGLIASFDGSVAVVTISRIGGEGVDLADGKNNPSSFINLNTGLPENESGNYLALSNDEIELFTQLKTLKDNGQIKSIVVLLNSSNAMEVDFLNDEAYGIDAALWIGSVGQSGINAVADILAGKVNPSGRLADTLCNDNYSAPAMQNAGINTWVNAADYADLNALTEMNYVVYQEGIYVGYLYYETRYEDFVMGTGNAGNYEYASDVAYPFGYGMSYSTFAYRNLSVEEKEDRYILSVDVTNNGSVPGKEVVEIYLQAPYTQYDIENGIEKAAVKLCAYAKTDILNKNETQTVTIEIPKEDLKVYDANGAETYIIEEGTYYLAIGNGAHDAVNNVLAAKGYTPENTDNRMDAQGNKNLVHSIEISKTDTETYAVSSHTGKEITNQLEQADLNKFDNGSQKITYLSRNDWEGTFPTSAVKLEMTDTMLEVFRAYQHYEANADAEMPTFGADNGMVLAMMKDLAYDDPVWEDLLDQITKEEMINLVANGMHMTAAVESIGKPETFDANGPVGLNQTFFGGDVNSIAYPSAVVMASTYNHELIEEVGKHIGENGLHCGVQGLYGPAVNIHRTPYAGRNFEYYSEDAILSDETACALTKGVQSKGMYVYIKHFVFCDQETMRGSTWGNEQSLREIYLKAFESTMAVDEGNAHASMVSHNRAGGTWIGHTTGLLQDIARDEWGYDGFFITDVDVGGSWNGWVDTSYMFAPTTVISGIDIFDCMQPDLRIAELTEKSNDPTVMQALRQATHRILYTVVNSSAMNGIPSAGKIVAITPWWKTALVVLDVVVAIAFVGSAIMFVRTKRRGKALENL